MQITFDKKTTRKIAKMLRTGGRAFSVPWAGASPGTVGKATVVRRHKPLDGQLAFDFDNHVSER